MRKPVALIILDGFGYLPTDRGNAVKHANTPVFDSIFQNYSHTLIGASGEDVGLPDGQMGNSEVGHLNIGAGRIVYQELTRITKEIREGSLFTNPALLEAMENAKKEGRALHLMGLLSDGGVHSHNSHIEGLLLMAKQQGVKDVYVHAFMDGRDTPPQSGKDYIVQLENFMKTHGIGKILTVSGRYYAMDRDKRWDRVKLAYDAIVKADAPKADSALSCIEASYHENVTDEFVLPTVIGEGLTTLSAHDSVIFFNFRPDRARELTRAIVDRDFDGFEREYFETTYVTMTQYDKTMPNVIVAYTPQTLDNTLGEYIASKGKTQLRIAETEKYAHVTFFFNGGREEAYTNEERILVPSPKVATYDLKPEMSAYEVTDRLINDLETNPKDLIVLNFANPDMVGHTGVFEAAVKAVETVDICLGKVLDKIKSLGGVAFITADHGNAEQMFDDLGGPFTAHTTNKVPFVMVDDVNKNIKLRDGGRLCDFAPTILEVMGLEKPEQMTGISLLIK
ncbi:phosphoglycero mutase III, cofactor-independent [Acetoanaerobium sticklandii]|uniref:2,3-bisphosphoglycerate-independent phosphoglycerate mutase n=1 Tax=Acetoanaerobium sticklandii (strain ATCC 12662 / DSM 519 / JCM 1433 / CCUG 9281 / NCIMB 10654 / HF) TaxID=499177 RepID=E3PWF6_ACESD|nr:2,3-bisphosphoglycerate-independent phosphoglycerate mutase [Acetoanaerobium sticklandii]CBH20771.1 phosphoglycero mutase III, cofactor-independent [Acetoanaerobium sticklandii]